MDVLKVFAYVLLSLFILNSSRATILVKFGFASALYRKSLEKGNIALKSLGLYSSGKILTKFHQATGRELPTFFLHDIYLMFT